MKVLYQSFISPEANIACEEYFFRKLSREMLDEEILRIWESPIHFVAIGNSQKVEESVYIESCERNNIKIIRRCSAGGAVLQGPGCLNFSLYYNLAKHPEVRNIQNSYSYILSKIVSVIFEQFNLLTEIKGIYDLVYKNRKVGGNAQRRNSQILLHHGTLLWDVDYELMEKTLKMPVEQPEYRMNRTHREFVGILPFTKEQLVEIIVEAFCNDFTPFEITEEEISEINDLAEEKYSKLDWNFRR
ncbi:MAG: lipoate--protein ligase family protein [Candidatus Hydrogenedentes bacterium]|nr:lipoate--protein ligase family protein [Candidatus Hydrogenedentota bacterium]